MADYKASRNLIAFNSRCASSRILRINNPYFRINPGYIGSMRVKDLPKGSL